MHPSVKRQRGLGPGLLGLLAAIALSSPAPARADEYVEFSQAKNAFDAGEYEQAVSRFEALLAGGLKNPALLLEAQKLAGISCLFIGDRERAERHFAELLNLEPGYTLDSLVFPVEVVDFFTEVKAKNEDRLTELAAARAEEEVRRRAEEEARARAEQEKLTRHVYLERTRTRSSLLVALLPFGAGQFQNGDTVKGALVLSGEVLLGAAAVTTYFLHEDLRKDAHEPFESTSERQDMEQLEKGYRIANQTSVVALAALAVIGIIDALYGFEKERVSWQPIDEKDVPEAMRPSRKGVETSLVPEIGPETIGVGFRGDF